MQLTYGADVEAFVLLSGKPAVVCGKLGGSKECPIQFPDEKEGFKYQEDGVTAEFNVPVCETPGDLITALSHVKLIGDAKIKQAFNPKASLEWASARSFNMKLLEKHPQAMRIGCDPDFQCYFGEGREREVPGIGKFGQTRFAGMHIHVGYDRKLIPPYIMAMCLDAFLYRRLDDGCVQRAAFYPRGIFRIKPYGVEYRALGSSWMRELAYIQDRLMSFDRSMKQDLRATLNSVMGNRERAIEQLLAAESNPLEQLEQPRQRPIRIRNVDALAPRR